MGFFLLTMVLTLLGIFSPAMFAGVVVWGMFIAVAIDCLSLATMKKKRMFD